MRSAVLALGMLCSIVRVNFHDLPVVYVRAERLFYCLNISVQCIRRNLHAVTHPAGYILNKLSRIFEVTLSDFESRH